MILTTKSIALRVLVLLLALVFVSIWKVEEWREPMRAFPVRVVPTHTLNFNNGPVEMPPLAIDEVAFLLMDLGEEWRSLRPEARAAWLGWIETTRYGSYTDKQDCLSYFRFSAGSALTKQEEQLLSKFEVQAINFDDGMYCLPDFFERPIQRRIDVFKWPILIGLLGLCLAICVDFISVRRARSSLFGRLNTGPNLSLNPDPTASR
jgi:hypothetical protein